MAHPTSACPSRQACRWRRLRENVSADLRLLTAVEGAPFAFEVGVDTEARTGSRTLRITGPDWGGKAVQREFVLRERTHNAWLDLFDEVARQFGTRVPRNRQAQ